jgi:hypothetical protein
MYLEFVLPPWKLVTLSLYNNLYGLFLLLLSLLFSMSMATPFYWILFIFQYCEFICIVNSYQLHLFQFEKLPLAFLVG